MRSHVISCSSMAWLLAVVACGPSVTADGDGTASATTSDSEATPTASASGPGDPDSTGTSLTGSDGPSSTSTTEGSDPEPPAPEPVCGDGVVDAYEECDDGNAVDDDACNNDCVPTAAIVWSTLIPSEGEGSWVHALATSPSGLIAVGGSVRMGPELVNAWVGVLDDGGTLQWSDQWDGGTQERDEVVDVAFDGTDDLYLAVSEANGEDNAWLYKRGPDGTPRWSVPMVAEAGASNYAASVVVGPDDGATVLARSVGVGRRSARMLQYTPDGDAAWPSPIDVDDDVTFAFRTSLHQDATGSLYLVLVRDFGDVGQWYAFLERFSPDGMLEWSVRSNPPVVGPGEHSVLGSTQADGRTTLVLYDLFAPTDLVLRSWDALGMGPQTLPSGLSVGLQLQASVHDSTGNLFVVANGLDGGWTIKIDAAGAVVWMRRFSGGGQAEAVAVTANDDVLVAGCTAGDGDDVWILRYSASAG